MGWGRHQPVLPLFLGSRPEEVSQRFKAPVLKFATAGAVPYCLVPKRVNSRGVALYRRAAPSRPVSARIGAFGSKVGSSKRLIDRSSNGAVSKFAAARVARSRPVSECASFQRLRTVRRVI
jgi:hypothetical protein